MLATVLCKLNRINFKGPSVASEGNYITNKLNLLKTASMASEWYSA